MTLPFHASSAANIPGNVIHQDVAWLSMFVLVWELCDMIVGEMVARLSRLNRDSIDQ